MGNVQVLEKKYDLAERTKEFALSVINFSRKLPVNNTSRILISQVVRSGTSIGANYSEADNAESKNDFIHKLGISKKEAKETAYWINIIITACPELKNEALIIYQEAKELNLIFNAIINKSRWIFFFLEIGN